MKKILGVILLVILIGVALVVAVAVYLQNLQASQNIPHQTGFHVGVAFGGNTTEEAKLLIDRVKDYTNLFVVQSGPVSVNETSLNEIVYYASDAGLDIIVYFGFFNPDYPWQLPWVESAKQRLGNQFLGVYLNDEPGGILIDYNWTSYFSGIKIQNTSDYYLHEPAVDLALNNTLPADYGQAAYHFVAGLNFDPGLQKLQNLSVTSFTSDYCLYWFDYLGGYDVLLAQYGWNQSIIQETALVRGAANLQNKRWGAIVTWTYRQPPYLIAAPEMYNQMVSAYRAGAEYVVIFNFPQIPGNPYGVLTDEHFAALERLWNDVVEERLGDPIDAEAVLVLPPDYGWGMRNPQDSIWGVWKPDETSQKIWNQSQKLLDTYGLRLDIVYQDVHFPVAGKYEQIYYWNQTE